MTSVFAKMLIVAALLGLSAASSLPAQTASSASPFMAQGGGGVAAAPTENAPLELRGIVSTKQGYLFGLYDPSKRQSMWVRQNEPGAEFTVRSHDVANDTINVDYQGRTMTLALKAAKVESSGPVPNPAQVVMQRPGSPMPGQPNFSINPTAAQEAARLEGVAAEVRRRRMLRQQASRPGAQPPMPVPQPGAQPLRR